MTRYLTEEPTLCWVGRTAQKIGCLPRKITITPRYYPIALSPVGTDPGYSSDIKYKPGPRLPPPQPDEPRPQTTPYIPTYQPTTPRVPKSPKKTPVARTVPLSTLPLPVNTLPVYTPITTCVPLNTDLPPVQPTVQITQTPYLAPLSVIPRTPRRDAVPESVFQHLGNIAPTQYTWNTQRGTLTYTPAPASHLPLPNPLANLRPCTPRIVEVGDGNDWSGALGFIPNPISSDSSSDCSDPDHQLGTTLHLHPLLASDHLLTSIEWDVSEPADMARHVQHDADFLANAGEPATNPQTNALHIELCFIDQPGARWNWEPITMRKYGPIRIADVLHEIHDYFQRQLTEAEYDIIKSHGKRNARNVEKSWRERVALQLDDGAQYATYHSGLRRVDCLGSCKIFSGLWVEGSQLKLGLCA